LQKNETSSGGTLMREEQIYAKKFFCIVSWDGGQVEQSTVGHEVD